MDEFWKCVLVVLGLCWPNSKTAVLAEFCLSIVTLNAPNDFTIVVGDWGIRDMVSVEHMLLDIDTGDSRICGMTMRKGGPSL